MGFTPGPDYVTLPAILFSHLKDLGDNLMARGKAKYWFIIIFYMLFIFLTLPIAPILWNYIQFSFGVLSIYSIYFIYLSGTMMLLGYLFFISQERNLMTYLGFAAIAGIFGYSLKTIAVPAEKIHLIEYALLSYFMGKALQLENPGNQDIRYFKAFLLITFIGFLDEVLQYFLPNRIFDIKDIFFNSLAGFLGLACFRLTVYPQLADSLKPANGRWAN